MLMQVFKFSGFGNYSSDFGWSSGLPCQLSLSSWQELNDDETITGLVVINEPGLYEGVFNDNSGSRSVHGYIVAEDREDAAFLLKEYESNFPVIQYQPD